MYSPAIVVVTQQQAATANETPNQGRPPKTAQTSFGFPLNIFFGTKCNQSMQVGTYTVPATLFLPFSQAKYLFIEYYMYVLLTQRMQWLLKNEQQCVYTYVYSRLETFTCHIKEGLGGPGEKLGRGEKKEKNPQNTGMSGGGGGAPVFLGNHVCLLG